MTRVFSATNATCGSMQFVWSLARRLTGHLWRNKTAPYGYAQPACLMIPVNGMSDSPFERSIEVLTDSLAREIKAAQAVSIIF